MGRINTTDIICTAVGGSSVRRSSSGASTRGVRNTTAAVIATLSLGSRGRIVVSNIISSKTSASRKWGSGDMMVAAGRTSSTYT